MATAFETFVNTELPLRPDGPAGTAGNYVRVKTTGLRSLEERTPAQTKGDVGLGNVDNTTDAGKPVSTAQQTALDLKANLASPTFSGTVTVPTPSAGSAAATKDYVDALANGLDWKPSVRVATTAAGTLASSFENGDTIDGIVLTTGDRILIKDQTAGDENGIYIVAASGAPGRAGDANVSAEVTAGMSCLVSEGTANADKVFVLTTNDPITLGTTPLVFTASFSGIPDGAVTFAKMQTVAASVLLGNDASGTAIEALSPTAARSVLNVEDGANNYVHPNHTGDVTSTGGGATVIGAAKVTPAMQTSPGRRQTRICRIDAPVAADEFQVVSIPDAATIKAVRHIVSAATNVVFNIEIRAEATPFTAGTDIWSSDKTATTTSAEETTFTNQPGAGKILVVAVTSVSGTPGKFLVQIEYEAD